MLKIEIIIDKKEKTMDILSNIIRLAQEYELATIQNLTDDEQEILMLKNELKNMKNNIASYVSKIYRTSTKEVQDILDNICIRVGIKK